MTTARFNPYKEFCKLMDDACYCQTRSHVFDDFLQLATCAFHPATLQGQKDDENEKIYMSTIKKYRREAIDIFPKLLVTLMKAVDDEPYCDLLGRYYEEFISVGANGQFFTPEPIAMLIAQICVNEGEENKTVLDPTCGAGIMLLAGAKVNPKNLFFGYDLDKTCVLMTALNCLLNGMRAEVGWCNSLSYDIYEIYHINSPIGIAPTKIENSTLYNVNQEQMRVFEIKQAEQLANMAAEQKKMLEEKQIRQVMKQGVKKMQVAENQINIFDF